MEKILKIKTDRFQKTKEKIKQAGFSTRDMVLDGGGKARVRVTAGKIDSGAGKFSNFYLPCFQAEFR